MIAGNLGQNPVLSLIRLRKCRQVTALDEAGGADYTSESLTAKTIARRLVYVAISTAMPNQALVSGVQSFMMHNSLSDRLHIIIQHLLILTSKKS